MKRSVNSATSKPSSNQKNPEVTSEASTNGRVTTASASQLPLGQRPRRSPGATASMNAKTLFPERRTTTAPASTDFWTHLSGVPALLREDVNFSWYLASRALIFGAVIGSGFFTVYALRVLRAPAADIGLFTALLLAGQMAGQIVLGWVGDRAGHRLVLVIAACVATVMNVVAFGAGTLDVFSVVFALNGFFNAAIQGTARMFMAAKNKRVRRVMYGIIGAAMMREILNQLLTPLDDDDEPLYDKIPEGEKERNMIIMLPQSADAAIKAVLPAVALIVLLYGFIGSHIPGTFGHAGIPADYYFGMLTITEAGLWGSLTGISVDTISLFIILGAFISAGQAGTGFMSLAGRIAGRFRAGAAKVAVLASAMYGTISGSASWYGAQFHGRQTASGERFDQNGLTAAHRTLPFGTKVRVTNRKNGRSVVVRINDRGPFHANRVIDLSRGAAQAVGMVGAGVAPVSLVVLGSG